MTHLRFFMKSSCQFRGKLQIYLIHDVVAIKKKSTFCDLKSALLHSQASCSSHFFYSRPSQIVEELVMRFHVSAFTHLADKGCPLYSILSGSSIISPHSFHLNIGLYPDCLNAVSYESRKSEKRCTFKKS